MKCISTHSLLYIQTAFSTNVETYIQYEHYAIHLPCTPEKTLHYLLDLHQKSIIINVCYLKIFLNIKNSYLSILMRKPYYFQLRKNVHRLNILSMHEIL